VASLLSLPSRSSRFTCQRWALHDRHERFDVEETSVSSLTTKYMSGLLCSVVVNSASQRLTLDLERALSSRLEDMAAIDHAYAHQSSLEHTSWIALPALAAHITDMGGEVA
jgi:hypothetical protein